jgi:hypothetical protein
MAERRQITSPNNFHLLPRGLPDLSQFRWGISHRICTAFSPAQIKQLSELTDQLWRQLIAANLILSNEQQLR